MLRVLCRKLLGLAVMISHQKLHTMDPERQEQSRQRVTGSVAKAQ